MASSTLLPKIQRKSMLPPMWSQLPCMNIDVNAVTSQPSPTAVPAGHELSISQGWNASSRTEPLRSGSW